MADDLKPHQRLVELPWQARLGVQPKPQTTRTERRLAMKTARKQKHGGKR